MPSSGVSSEAEGELAGLGLSASRLTILFTDLEGSTRLLDVLGESYETALVRQFELIREATFRHGGVEVDIHGDAFFAVFENAARAVAASADAQRLLHSETWPQGVKFRVRMGLHTGRPRRSDSPGLRFVGLDIHRAARICALAHGGQVLVSRPVLEDPSFSMPEGVTLRDLGTYQLKDIDSPEALADLVIEGLPSSFPSLRSPDNRPNNLPSALRPLIGRKAERKAIRALLRRKDTRLVTLTGAGGIGKTRLALDVAGALLDDFPDGVFQVQLAAITVPELVAPAIAQAMRFLENPVRSILESLSHAIGQRRILLLLDNFEQVIPAQSLIVDLLQACKRLKIIVTSREPLGIAPEREYPLRPLALPDVSQGLKPAQLMRYDGILMFVERVRAFQPDFTLTADIASALVEVCQRLDGLPLAIELAASRIRMIDPETLLRRLQTGQERLLSSANAVTERHRSLRNAIGWSFNLLDPEERLLITRLSVFAGGFDLESAVALNSSVDGGDQVVELINSLGRKSLLQRTGSRSSSRIRMLETVREFALEQLAASGDLAAVSNQHLDHVSTLVAAAAERLTGPHQREAAARIQAEMDNVRAALDYAIHSRRLEAASAILRSLLWYWIPRGQFTEGETWASRALKVVPDEGEEANRAAILDVAGWLRMMAGDWAGAGPYFQACRPLYQSLGLEREAAMTLMTEGITQTAATGDLEGSEKVHAALARFRDLDDPYGVGLTLTALGEAARLDGDHARAGVLFDEALIAMRKAGNSYWIGALLQNLAYVRLHGNDWAAAVTFLGEALDIASEYDNPMLTVYYVAAMARVGLIQGQFNEAARLCGAAEAHLERMGAQLEPADQMEFDMTITQARAQLTEPAFQSLRREGMRWSANDAIAAAAMLRGH
ncbi:tetratricopeptide repeat protein [Aestuariivirga sp.]|uniref:tetratricopeptide repeat protein n=1 Tax=Aestuariivirga sp. TaxID=2650926 RepID=UPI003BA94930